MLRRCTGFLLACLLLLVMCMALPAPAATTNPSPASPGYIVMPLTFHRTVTATVIAQRFAVPFHCAVIGVTASAETIDLTDTDETYTVDVKEGGTSILSSAISIAAADTVYAGTVSDTALADEAVITVVYTLGGTTPSLTDATVLLILKRL